MSIHQRSWSSLGLSDGTCVLLLKAGFDHAGHLENIEPEYLAEGKPDVYVALQR